MIGDDDDRVRARCHADRNPVSSRQMWAMPDASSSMAVMPGGRVGPFPTQATNGGEALSEVVDPADNGNRRQRFSLMGLTAVPERLSCRQPPGQHRGSL